MLFSDDRRELRRFFFEAWRRQVRNLPLQPMERAITAVIARHPEYHALFEDPDAHLERDYPPELGAGNPFLHLAMHVALQEQLTSGRPEGVAALHRTIMARCGEYHAAEHRMMECLAESLWLAQRAGRAPEESDYLECLRRLARE